MKKATIETYYAGTNLRPWSFQDLVRDRVNKESWAQNTYVAPRPKKHFVDVLRPSVGLKNFYSTMLKFVMEFRP